MMRRILGAARSRLGRNALLNLAGLAVPLAVAAFVFPALSRALGPARFGLLGMSWAFLEYLTLFNVGLGKATVRFVADSLARGSNDVPQITAVSLATQLALGALAGLALAAAAPVLAHDVFRIAPNLTAEATRTFVVVGFNLPVVLALTTMRAVLEGAQRFDVSNALKIPSAAGSVVIPAILALMGYSLPAILLWVLAWRALMTVATAAAAVRVVPGFRLELPRAWQRLRGLLGFGGWVAVSGVVSPMLVYFDRFALGARAGMADVGYYTAPFEAVTRLLMVPNALINALFPMLTGLGVAAAQASIDRLFARSMRVLAVVMAIPAGVALLFAPLILRVWIGPDYAAHAGTALRVLALGVLVNALAHVPYTFLEASGRPDVPAKFHVLELVIHVPLAWWLVGRYGITGAAIAWTTRVTLDTMLLVGAARAIVPVSLRRVVSRAAPPEAAAT